MRRQTWLVTLLFVALTAVMTWPQVLHLATRAREHQDVYFNMWRLQWMAHALANAPARFFDGNIFHPEPRTLTFSDAMLVEGVLAAPLAWIGLPPMLIHNLLLLGAMVSSGAGMFVLARSLTTSPAAGIAAGIIFAFVPYRFDHYMHMELQWTTWMPWAFWAMHRTVETRAMRFGVLTGVFFSLQFLSCIYYGVFLSIIGTLAGMLLLADSRATILSGLRAFAPGALLAVIVCGAYALPYLATSRHVGMRSDAEILTFSARPSNYLVATPDNAIWGSGFSGRSRPERRLFPGALAFLLGIVGLLQTRRSLVPLIYLIVAAAAFELSLGFSGYSYPFLSEQIPIFRGLRALSRAGIFVAFALAVLAAFGLRALVGARSQPAQVLISVAICTALLVEYRVRPLRLTPFPNDAPAIQAWLATQLTGVVAELPMGDPAALPGPEARYAYLSTFHWKPIVNGYSGYFPRSFLERASAMRGFPDERSLDRLRHDGVRYLVVHLEQYSREDQVRIDEALTERAGFPVLARFAQGEETTVVWAVR
ncbi:MAG TPA: hypothetical protein VD833_10345 [Vicinamibacterales bacterium]|nr:hypothetical protein [Vicinamibacterales bacterium]